MSPLPLRASAATHLGRRTRNEDAWLADEERSLFAVADGVGGVPGGAEASRAAVDALARFFAGSAPGREGDPAMEAVRLDLAFRLANRAVAELGAGRTTLVALRAAGEGHVVIGHVGDSRAYRLRDSRLVQLTRDHSRVAELDAASVGALVADRHAQMLTRALGGGEPGHDVQIIDVEPDDRFLLCSDGLSGVVSAHRIASIVSAAPRELAPAALISEAWHADATDNITAVVISAGPDELA